MKKLIIHAILLLPCATLFSSSYTQKYKDLINTYDNPIFYKFEFYRYHEPRKQRGLIEKIETSFILCEDQHRREFNARDFGKDLPLDIGYVTITKYSREQDAFRFYSRAGYFYNEQDTMYRHEKTKHDPLARKYLKRDDTPFVKAIQKHLTVQDPIKKSYIRWRREIITDAWRINSPTYLETLLYLDQNSTEQKRNETAMHLPDGLYYRNENGKLEFTENKKLILRLLPTKKSINKKTMFIYIQQ